MLTAGASVAVSPGAGPVVADGRRGRDHRHGRLAVEDPHRPDRVERRSHHLLLLALLALVVGFLLGRTGWPARRQSVADLHQRRGQRVGVARHPAGEPVGVILAAPAEPEDDVLTGDVEHIRPDGHRDPVPVVLPPAARLHGRPVGEVEQERHELDDRHQQHVPVLAVADLVRHDALDLRGLEQVEDALGDHDPHVVGMVPVGEGIRRTVVDQAEPGHAHVLLGGHPGDELAQVLGQLVGRDPRELVDPPQRQVHQPGAEHELEDDDPHADRDRDAGREDAQLGQRDQHQAEDAVEQEQHARRPDEEVRQGQHPGGDVADAVVGALVALRPGRVERRIGDGPGTIVPLPVLGLELERVAVGLHRLLELAGVEPVALAFGAAVDLQFGPEERDFLQVHPASRTLPIGRDGSFRVQLEQLFELPRLATEQEDLASVEPDPLAGLAGIDQHAALGHRLDQRGRCTTRTIHRRGLPPVIRLFAEARRADVAPGNRAGPILARHSSLRVDVFRLLGRVRWSPVPPSRPAESHFPTGNPVDF